jgi:uncharacterized membrane protein YphA (DoxX/SURF4 family)
MATLERFFFQPLHFRGLFVMRAAFGSIAIFYYLRLLPYVQGLFGPAGINGHDTAQRWPGFPMPVTENLEHFALLGGVAAPSLVWLLYGLLILAAVLFTLGLFTRVAGLMLVALHAVFASHQPGLVGGWSKLYPVLALYLTLAPSGAAWSLDAWRKRRRDPTHRPSSAFSPWALRLLQVHVIAMYATAGWPRLVNQAWLRGETVFHAAADTRYGRWDLNWHALHPLLSLATYAALVLEPAATLLLPWRATRRWCALALIALHLGIELIADVGMWGFMMIAAVCAFLPDQWFRSVPGLKDDNLSPDAGHYQVVRHPT